MLRFLVSRLGLTILMALLATLVIFLIANMVPGDPILAQLGDVAASNKEFVAEWRAKWGLDLPLWERYFIFLKGLLHRRSRHFDLVAAPGAAGHRTVRAGDAGTGDHQLPARPRDRHPLGIIAAVRRDSWIDPGSPGWSRWSGNFVVDLLAGVYRAGDFLWRP